MDKLLAVLERIATSCEQIAASQKARDRDEYDAKARRIERFRLQIEEDKRFPGLAIKGSTSLPMTELVRDQVMDAPDPVAMVNALVNDQATLKRLNALEPEELTAEIERLSRRVSIKAV